MSYMLNLRRRFTGIGNIGDIIIFLIIAFLFRIILIRINPQPFLHDQLEYYVFGEKIARSGLQTMSARTYGFPLILSFFIYILHNYDRVYPVILVFQAILDSLTGLLVYLAAGNIFKNRVTAFLAFGIYVLNPYTSVYAGLVLTEIVSIFFVALILWMASRSNGIYRFSGWLWLFGFTAGYLVQIRPAMMAFSLGAVVLMLIDIGKKISWSKSVLIIIGFMLPFIYNLYFNWQQYRQFAPMTVDNLFVRELYISLFNDRSPPHAVFGTVFPKQIQDIYSEYSVKPQTPADRRDMANKYFGLALSQIRKDPSRFVYQRLGKMWYVWEKSYLYYFRETPNRIRDIVLGTLNILILFLGFSGIIHAFIRDIQSKSVPHIGISLAIWLIISVSLTYSLSLAEERYTLPAYPIMIMFAAYSIVKIFHGFKNGHN